MIKFYVNNEAVTFDGVENTPLLWVLRDHLKLTGTKFGCGIGSCGACTVHINGRARKTCTIDVSSVAGKTVTTIEGLAPPGGKLHPVQQAWIEEDVPQCGYCQGGQIMAAVDLLEQTPNPSDADIAREMRNICRCGTYVRIRKAIHRASALIAEEQ
jgi:aerobic-type carbon monoxide dehydrogenase small subunit (CoxS/CutS family)